MKVSRGGVGRSRLRVQPEAVGYGGRLANWQQIADAAKKTPGVTSALPLIEQPLMASANGRVEGVLVRGQARQRGRDRLAGFHDLRGYAGCRMSHRIVMGSA